MAVLFCLDLCDRGNENGLLSYTLLDEQVKYGQAYLCWSTVFSRDDMKMVNTFLI